MQEGDICRVLVDKGRGHPAGTIVKVIMIKNDELYCRAVEGRTEYWYKKSELEILT